MANLQESNRSDVPVVDLTKDDCDSSSVRVSTQTPAAASVTPTGIRSAPPKLVARKIFGNGAAPASSSKAAVKPKKTIQRLSLAEQRDLTQRTNRIARLSLSKNEKCTLCKVKVSRGYDQRRGRPNFDVHLEGHQHSINLQRLLGNWATKGCFLCPNKKFCNKIDYENHLKGRGHIRRARLDHQRLNANRN